MGHKHAVLQQTECKYVDGDDTLMQRTFVGISPQPLFGRIFRTTDQVAFTARAGVTFQCDLEHAGGAQRRVVRVRPMFTDNVTVSVLST